MVFRIVRRDGSVDVWGVDDEAAYEVRRDGTLRVVVFDVLPDWLHHAREAALYQTEDWTDIDSSSPPMHPGRSRMLDSEVED